MNLVIIRKCVTSFVLTVTVIFTAVLIVSCLWLPPSTSEHQGLIVSEYQGLPSGELTSAMINNNSIAYSRDFLLSHRMISVHQLSSDVIDTVQNLNLAKMTPWKPHTTCGCRGGRNKQRRIKSVISNRSNVRYQTNSKCVNHSNLVQVLTDKMSNINSLKLTVCLLNARSVRNKTEVIHA